MHQAQAAEGVQLTDPRHMQEWGEQPCVSMEWLDTLERSTVENLSPACQLSDIAETGEGLR